MFLLYSILLTLGFLLMLPLFLLRREKYASGFRQRLGNYPGFKDDERNVIWLHCVSVGETNAARPLVDAIRKEFPDHRLVVSTTTKTGQELARKIFADNADAVIYFPFDWKFSVRRVLERFKPSLVLLMETEIWPRFIREAKLAGAKVTIVNGRLSQRSFQRYARVRPLIRTALADIDLALMQDEADARRIIDLGMPSDQVSVTGNLKFEQPADKAADRLTDELRTRFAISPDKPLIIAASTHEPEERYVIESLVGELGHACRLMIVPRHPERFDHVEKLLCDSPYSFVRRSSEPSDKDKTADIILLDTIGELRAAYPLAAIVFVGGSLIQHGGQSILEPAAEGKAIVTGPFTENFRSIINVFLSQEAIIQLAAESGLASSFVSLLHDPAKREFLGKNAKSTVDENSGASQRTIEAVKRLLAA